MPSSDLMYRHKARRPLGVGERHTHIIEMAFHTHRYIYTMVHIYIHYKKEMLFLFCVQGNLTGNSMFLNRIHEDRAQFLPGIMQSLHVSCGVSCQISFNTTQLGNISDTHVLSMLLWSSIFAVRQRCVVVMRNQPFVSLADCLVRVGGEGSIPLVDAVVCEVGKAIRK